MSRNIGIYKRIWDRLGSREFSIFIFITIITYSIISYVFGLLVPASWFDFFQTLLPLLVLYSIFFTNLFICEIKWMPVVIRRCKKPQPPKHESDLSRLWRKIDVENVDKGLDEIRTTLKKKGFSITIGEEDTGKGADSILHACRGITSPIGNLLFHLSFFVLFAGIVVGILYRVEGNALVIEGKHFDGQEKSYKTLSLSPLAKIPDLEFSLKSIAPKFWGNEMLFTDLRADMILKNDSTESAWLSEAVGINGVNITIKGLGYAIKYILQNSEGQVLESELKRLDLFMPGDEAAFNIPGYPHKLLIAYYPDAKVNGEKVVNRSMNRINPVIGLRVYRGRLPVYAGLLKEGEEAEFDGLKLSIPEVRYWGDFKIIKNRGFILIWIAFLMMIGGLGWRFIFCRREIVAVGGNRSLRLYCQSEFFPRLFEARVRESLRG